MLELKDPWPIIEYKCSDGATFEDPKEAAAHQTAVTKEENRKALNDDQKKALKDAAESLAKRFNEIHTVFRGITGRSIGDVTFNMIDVTCISDAQRQTRLGAVELEPA